MRYKLIFSVEQIDDADKATEVVEKSQIIFVLRPPIPEEQTIDSVLGILSKSLCEKLVTK